MIITVNKSQVGIVNDKFVGEASTMGLRVGEWPLCLALLNDQNEGFLFWRGSEIKSDGGEFAGYNYATESGTYHQLVVFND